MNLGRTVFSQLIGFLPDRLVAIVKKVRILLSPASRLRHQLVRRTHTEIRPATEYWETD